ncbi:MAG: superoxide dismutase family protein [Myxococcales bacterium]|nr:superoxide dismutase family protein [Myxococcales bacterium]
MIRARWLVALVPSLLLVACGGSKAAPPANPEPTPPAAEEKKADEAADGEKADEKKAEEKKEEAPAALKGPLEIAIEGRSGSKLTGTLTLEQVDDGVKVSLMVKNAPPGHHGAHIHEKADCSAPDAKSAGDHFNPDGHKHGMPPGDERHLGDLGNLDVGKNGEGKIDMVVKGANLIPGDKHSFLDRGVIVHQKKDDGGQPTGNAGGRIGCGEIKAK